MRWRIIKNEHNISCAPWSDAIGIEEDDDRVAVPEIICWFTRPDGKENALHVVDLHNRGMD
jgi:hypothetical protein